jgi:hypothetical protein
VRPCEKGMLFHTEYWERENKGWGRVGGGWRMHLEVVLHICVPTGAAAHKGLPVLEVDAVVDVAQAAEHHPDLCARQRQREWEQFRGAGQDGSGPGAKGEGRAARRVSTGPHRGERGRREGIRVRTGTETAAGSGLLTLAPTSSFDILMPMSVSAAMNSTQSTSPLRHSGVGVGR